MSIITLDYPNSLQVRRTTSMRWIIILVTGLALVASIILVAASTSPKVDSSSGVVAVPVAVAPVADAYVPPSATVTPAPDPAVIAVAVPEPPTP